MKRGFTLVELLAVIVILAIVLAIAIPSIAGVLNDSSKNTLQSDAKLVLKAVDYKLLEDETFDVTTINETNIETLLKIDATNYQSLTIKKVNGLTYITIVGQGKWNDYTASGTKTKIIVNDTVETLTYGANIPALATGMTPIKWSGTAWVETTEDDADWYSYDSTTKKWANAITEDGSMWVWIPRYIYKISSGWHSNETGTIDLQFSKGIDDNWNKSVIGNIVLGETSNASNNTWTNHPAFTFGDTEVTGIWVAKFEATASEGVANGMTNDGSCPTTGDNVTTKTVKILPSVQSWRCITQSNAFTVSYNMEKNSIYGWGTSGTNIDTHLTKNIEWGAMVYLSKSIYGKDTNEIWINPANNYTTGCAGASATSAITTGCTNVYTTLNGLNASSTGNINGIYDISGGAWERTAAYIDNSNINITTYGLALLNSGSKYKDLYTKGTTDDQASNYALTINKKGDAIYETSSTTNGAYGWFSDYILTPTTSTPMFIYGCNFAYGANAGAFHFYTASGYYSSGIGFRPVLLVAEGL